MVTLDLTAVGGSRQTSGEIAYNADSTGGRTSLQGILEVHKSFTQRFAATSMSCSRSILLHSSRTVERYQGGIQLTPPRRGSGWMALRHQMRELLSSGSGPGDPGKSHALPLPRRIVTMPYPIMVLFFILFYGSNCSLPDEDIRPPLCLLDRGLTVDGDHLILSWTCFHWCPCRAMDFKFSTQAMKNVGPGAIHNVTSTYTLDSWNTYSYTWNVTFSASFGDVPELTIEPGHADLSSIGADVAVTTVQVTRL